MSEKKKALMLRVCRAVSPDAYMAAEDIINSLDEVDEKRTLGEEHDCVTRLLKERGLYMAAKRYGSQN